MTDIKPDSRLLPYIAPTFHLQAPFNAEKLFSNEDTREGSPPPLPITWKEKGQPASPPTPGSKNDAKQPLFAKGVLRGGHRGHQRVLLGVGLTVCQ